MILIDIMFKIRECVSDERCVQNCTRRCRHVAIAFSTNGLATVHPGVVGEIAWSLASSPDHALSLFHCILTLEKYWQHKSHVFSKLR